MIGYIALTLLIPEEAFGVVFGLVAGMMVFISIDELIPAAQRYQTRPHQSIYGLVGGMFVVALSLVQLS